MVWDCPGLQAWTMTTTPPEAPTGSDEPAAGPPAPGRGPRVSREDIRDLGRLRRSRSDRKVAGVAGGLARHLDIDPVILRVALVVLVFFGGAGLLVYGACWLLLPEDGSQNAPITLDERSRTVALVIVGGVAGLAVLGDSLGGFGFPWPLAVVALIAVVVLNHRSHTTPPRGAAGTTDWQQPPAYSGAPYTAAPTYAAAQVSSRAQSRRGPVLFWFTLALIVMGIGVLGVLDLAGAPVADPAYPALAVGTTGLMLLVGAFYGRAGGLILVGLLSTIGLVVATVAGDLDGDQVRATPQTSATVESFYEIGAGELVIDLSKISDIEALDGRMIRAKGRIGRIEVIVPDDIDVKARAAVNGPGQILLFGQVQEGIDVNMLSAHEGGDAVPSLRLDIELFVGEIDVHTDQESSS